MNASSFFNLCAYHVQEGLRDGLSHFSQPSRAALIYAETPTSDICIYDPQDLLRGHEPILEKFFIESQEWRTCSFVHSTLPSFDMRPCDSPSMTGIISYSAHCGSVFHQTWCTEQHPDLCSLSPTEHWLEHAAWVMSQAYEGKNTLLLDLAGTLLQGWSTHAVRNAIVDARTELIGMDTQLRIFPVLDAILAISKTLEEGEKPRGILCFIEPSALRHIHFLARLEHSERPAIHSHKHVRKLLQSVETSGHFLVSDGESIVGIAEHCPEGAASLRAEFCGTHGFLWLEDQLLCSFSDGSFHSSTRKANLVSLEELLIEAGLDSEEQHDLFSSVSQIVESTRERRHGCTLVLDFQEECVSFAGQRLEEPLLLSNPKLLQVARNLAEVDGALHIRKDNTLHGFGCLLDGAAVPAENRSRGARYNSALRFTAARPNIIVVVVSCDRPVSIIFGGVEMSAACPLPPSHSRSSTPHRMEDWLKHS